MASTKNRIIPKKRFSTLTAIKRINESHIDNGDDHYLEEKLFKSSTYYAWIAMIFSIIIWYKFGGSSTVVNLGNTSNIYRMGLVMAGGVLALNLILKNSNNISKNLPPPLFLMLLYGITAFFSSLIVPTNAFYTMWKSIEILIDVTAMIGIIAATRSVSGPLTAYRLLMFYNALMLVFVIGGAIISPGDGLRPSRGIVPFFLQGYVPLLNPNTIGFISVQLLIHCTASFFRSTTARQKHISVLFFVLSLITLILAQSRTSSVGMVVGLVVYLFLDKKRGIAMAVIATGAIIMLFTSGADLVIQYMQRGQSEELMMSLSGRTHGWTAAWDMFQQSPWFGHGFAAAARTEILGTGAGAASTLHGALFDILVGVGLAGLVPWSIAVLYFINKMVMLTIRSKKWIQSTLMRSIHAEMCAVTLIILIRAGTSSGVSMHDHAFMLLLCLIGYSVTAGKTKHQAT